MTVARFVMFNDGAGMGDSLYIAKTNAPKEALNALLRCSRTMLKQGHDMPIWHNVLEQKGYEFDVIDEHRNVTAYGTSHDWQQEQYPNVIEEYCI